MLTLEELRAEVESGAIDTVVTAFTDMQGRLMGKREHAEFFLDESAEHGPGCNYLLALDMEMDPQPGYDGSWGAARLPPEAGPATLRRLPWLEGTALVLCACLGRRLAVVASPRVQRSPSVRRMRGSSRCSPELEFYVLKVVRGGARELSRPPVGVTSLSCRDDSSSPDPPDPQRMQAAGIPVESPGEAWPDSREINSSPMR